MPEKLEFTSTESPQAVSQPSAQVYDDLAALSQKTERSRDHILLKGYSTAVIVLAVAVVLLAVAAVVMAIGWSHEQGTVVPEVIEVEKDIVVEVPVVTVLSPSEEFDHAISDEQYLLNDSNYGPIWMPILKNVDRNEYDPELFVTDEETGYISYSDGEIDALMGIDVSKYQGSIDWEQVKEAGFDFVIIRCGNRGYVTGAVVEDDNYRQNISGALDAGLQVGVYFFSQAIDMEEAVEEAEFIIDLLDGYEITFPVFYDWEVVIDPDYDARTAYIRPDDLTNNFLVFAQRLELEGYIPAVYANKKTAVWKYDLSRISDYDIWYAEYSDAPTLPYDFEMWQYSSHGSVPGIKGNVDLNICFKNYASENR